MQAHRISPQPEAAEALRARIPSILKSWTEQVRQAMPPLKELTSDEIIDHLPLIVSQIAVAVEQGTDDAVHRLLELSPGQGLARFAQRYEIREVFGEDRILRQLIIEHATAELGRALDAGEQTSLNAAVDLMLQQSISAFVEEQQAQLRDATATELQHLSFLSHDLNNSLSSVTLHLQLLRMKLTETHAPADMTEPLDLSLGAIHNTLIGMRKLTQTERARGKRVVVESTRLDAGEFLRQFRRQFAPEAEAKGLKLDVDVPDGLTVESDGEVLTLVIQNLLGNAIKYSSAGTVRLAARGTTDGWALSVTDNGPGIAPMYLDRLFEVGARGDTNGQSGRGLGLSIAARAAKLLGGRIDVTSTVGVGSTFTVSLPRA